MRLLRVHGLPAAIRAQAAPVHLSERAFIGLQGIGLQGTSNGGEVSEHPSRNGLERGREMAEEEWLREREWKRGRTGKKIEPRPPPA